MGHGLFFPSGPEAGFDGDPKTLVELYASKSLKGAMVGFGSSPDANVLDGGFWIPVVQTQSLVLPCEWTCECMVGGSSCERVW